MEKININFMLYDELQGGDYIGHSSGHKIDDSNVVIQHSEGITIYYFSEETEERVLVPKNSPIY